MGMHVNIYSDRQYSEVQKRVEKLKSSLKGGSVIDDIRAGLPAELTSYLGRTFERELVELNSALRAYEDAKAGSCETLISRAGPDLGERLIATRVCRGLSQKELARKLGIKEQAVQRWEADNYRSITLSNFQNVVRVLGLTLSIDELGDQRRKWAPSFETPKETASKVLRHARSRNWLDGASDERELIRRVGDHVLRYGTPSLLRTGIRETGKSQKADDWMLIAWKAQVAWKAEQRISKSSVEYSPLDVDWLPDLVKFSRVEDGPKAAQSFLADKGIILVIEPQVPGMPVDGAAFLLNGTPVIGMTLRKNTIDNFWFTIMHEIGHVILHYRAGLNAGFFDDFDGDSVDEAEQEADFFAQNILIPDHVWAKSIARIAKDPKVIMGFANKIGIGPEIVFGRLRKERNDYGIFSKHIGQGRVRRLFPEYEME